MRKSTYAKKVSYQGAPLMTPKNATQRYHESSIIGSAICVITGPAGTGKTFVSGMTIAALFSSGAYEKIVLCRANVPTGNTLGHFPGDIREKLTPWLLPMISVLKRALGNTKFEYLLQRDQIEYQPLETIRGRSFENTLVMIDESQNLTLEELKAITTRMGEGSKMVLMGDVQQSDVDNGYPLRKLVAMCNKHGIAIPVIEYGVEDIVRSDIVGALVKMFYQEGL